MDSTHFWRTFFLKWPATLPHQGVLVTSFGEQVVFVEFMLSEYAILVQRLAPDSMGGRKLVLPYEKIEAVKITEPVENEIFAAGGFRAVPSASPPAQPGELPEEADTP